MATIEQYEAELRPYKLALIDAFGLDREKTSMSISANPGSATFQCVGGVTEVAHDLTANPTLIGESSNPGITTVEFESQWWNEEQRKAVADYIGQFPSLGDFLKQVQP